MLASVRAFSAVHFLLNLAQSSLELDNLMCYFVLYLFSSKILDSIDDGQMLIKMYYSLAFTPYKQIKKRKFISKHRLILAVWSVGFALRALFRSSALTSLEAGLSKSLILLTDCSLHTGQVGLNGA